MNERKQDTMEETIKRLQWLVSEKLDMNIRMEDINPDAPLLEGGLMLDSLAIVELITLTEDTFGIEFGENDLNMQAFASLRSLAAVVTAHEPAAV